MILPLKSYFRRGAAARATDPLLGLTQAVLIDWRDTGAVIAFAMRYNVDDVWIIEKEVTIAWAVGGSGGMTAVQKGEMLRQALREHNVRGKHVVVSVPRRHAFLKLLEFDAIPNETLTDAVLLQAEIRNHSSDSYVIDYVPHDNLMKGGTVSGSTYATLAAYPKDYLLDVRTAIESAGLELRAIGLGELSLARLCFPRASSALDLIILQEQDSYTFVVCFRRRPVSLLHVRRQANEQGLETFINATIDRISTAMPQAFQAREIASVFVLGSNSNEIVNALNNGSRAFKRIPSPKSVAMRPWLLATDDSPCDLRIDFFRAKNGGEAKANSRKRHLVLATRGVLVASLLLLCFQFLLSRWDTSIAGKSAELSRLEADTLAQAAVLQTADQLASWQMSQVDWSKEITGFLSLLPDNSRVFLQRLRIEQPIDQPAEIRIEGLARSLDDAIELKQRMLAKAPYYQMRPENIERHDRNPYYSLGVIVSATLHPMSDSEPAPAVEANAP